MYIWTSTRYGFTTLWAGWHRRNVMTTVCGWNVRGKGGVRLYLVVQKHGVTTVGVSLFLVMKIGPFEIRVD